MNNIGIEINGEFIDLNASTIRLERVNPFFIQEVYQGDFSFPFELPLTDKNIRIFKHVNSPEIIERQTEFDAWLYLYGAPHAKAKLIVTKASLRSLTAVLSGGIKALSNSAKKLAEIDLGPDINLGNTRQEAAALAKTATHTGDWKQYPYVFAPFNAPNFYGDLNPDFNGVVNRVNPTTGDIYTNDPLSSLNTYTLAPWFFLFYILNQIFKEEKLTPSGTFWNDEEFNKILLFNNRALDFRPPNKSTMVRVANEQLFNSTFQLIEFDLDGPGTWDNISSWDATIDEYIIKTTGEHHVSVNLIVNGFNDGWAISDDKIFAGLFYLMYDGSIISAGGGTAVSVSIYHKDKAYTVSLNAVITAAGGDIGKTINVMFNTSGQRGTPYVKVYPGSTFNVEIDPSIKRPTPKSILAIKDYMPDITVGELLVEVKKMGVMFDIDYNTGTAKLDTVRDLLNEAVVSDFTNKFNKNGLLNFEDKGKGILVEYVYDGNDEIISEIDLSHYIGDYMNVANLPIPSRESDIAIITLTREVFVTMLDPTTLFYSWEKKGYYVPKFKIGKGENVLQCKLAPMLMVLSENEGGTADQNKALMPYYSGTGSSDLFGLGANPCPLRFAFWRGVNNTGHAVVPQGGIYVLLSTGTIGKNEQTVGFYTADLDKNNSIIRYLCERLYLAINESVVYECNWYPDPVDVYTMKSFKKIIVNNDLYLTKNISFGIAQRGTDSKALLLKL